MTLLELLIATAIMSLMAAGLSALATAVNRGNAWAEDASTAAQHARVTIERITRSVVHATANEQFPGAIVVSTNVAGYDFPDALVVWRPAAAPVDPAGLPRFGEVVIYSPSASDPRQILEITLPGDSRVVPAPSDAAAWQAELAAIGANGAAKKSVLTDRVHVARTTTGTTGGGTTARAAVRFVVERRPSATAWAEYRGGTRAWSDIPWAQGFAGTSGGLAQTWVRLELQLVAGTVGNSSSEQAIAFFGSAALYYRLAR